MRRERLALLLLIVAYMLGWAYDRNNVLAQERRADDRPKDSQDVCGYTLEKGQVQRISDANSFIKLQLIGSPDVNLERIESGPVCAFKVDNQNLTDVRIIFITRDEARPYSAPPRMNDVTTGVLLYHHPKLVQ